MEHRTSWVPPCGCERSRHDAGPCSVQVWEARAAPRTGSGSEGRRRCRSLQPAAPSCGAASRARPLRRRHTRRCARRRPRTRLAGTARTARSRFSDEEGGCLQRLEAAVVVTCGSNRPPPQRPSPAPPSLRPPSAAARTRPQRLRRELLFPQSAAVVAAASGAASAPGGGLGRGRHRTAARQLRKRLHGPQRAVHAVAWNSTGGHEAQEGWLVDAGRPAAQRLHALEAAVASQQHYCKDAGQLVQASRTPRAPSARPKQAGTGGVAWRRTARSAACAPVGLDGRAWRRQLQGVALPRFLQGWGAARCTRVKSGRSARGGRLPPTLLPPRLQSLLQTARAQTRLNQCFNEAVQARGVSIQQARLPQNPSTSIHFMQKQGARTLGNQVPRAPTSVRDWSELVTDTSTRSTSRHRRFLRCRRRSRAPPAPPPATALAAAASSPSPSPSSSSSSSSSFENRSGSSGWGSRPAGGPHGNTQQRVYV